MKSNTHDLHFGSTTGSRISRIEDGVATTFVDNLPSSQAGGLASGVADVAFIGNTMYAIFAVAISNQRLLSFDGHHVRFRCKDYAHGNKRPVMTLTASEFLRRFCQHVLPRGFVRIRHFGYLASAHRTSLLALARQLLACPPPLSSHHTNSSTAVWRCPRCGANMLIGPNLTAQHWHFDVPILHDPFSIEWLTKI